MDTQVKPQNANLAASAGAEGMHKREKSYKGVVVAVAALLALGALAWYLTHRDAVGGGKPGIGGPGGPGFGGPGGGRGPTSTVGVASAEKADIPVVLDALGTVTAAATVTVRPQVSGVLQQVNYREGQNVKAGQVLATIDPRQFELSLMQATGQRQRDEAQLENARLTLKRFRTLLEQDSIARQDVDTQEALVKQLEGTVIADRATEGTARLNLSYTKVVAPVSGKVGLRLVDNGNIVNPGDANGIAVITQVAPIDVAFAIPQDQVPEVQASLHESAAAAAGKEGSLKVEALDRARTATLDTGRFLALDNQVDTQTGTVRAKARFANDAQKLFPSQFVNVKLMLRTVEDAIVVPVTAVRHGSKGDYVYVLNVEDHTVSLRPVTRGQTGVDKVQIADGLKVGEKVITEGADRLRDGSKVNLPGERPSGMAGDKGGRGAGGSKGGRGPKGDAASGGASDAAPAGEHRRPQASAS